MSAALGTTAIAIAAPAPSRARTGLLRRAWIGVQSRRLAAMTRRTTAGLDDRLRDDIGLGPQGAAAPAIPSMAEAWMR